LIQALDINQVASREPVIFDCDGVLVDSERITHGVGRRREGA